MDAQPIYFGTIPEQAVVAAAIALIATMGAHLAAEKILPDQKHPLVSAAVYAAGTGLCAALTYYMWCEFAEKASIAASVAWGLAHPVATGAMIWAARKHAPGLLRDVKRKHRGAP